VFNKPLSQIEYSDVEKFCATFGEGVRVEYKNEMIDKIPKTISAFANTSGGIIVIGVEVDKTQNKVTAINGIDSAPGLEERVINSALIGIYPSVIPEVKILEIPNAQNKILVVIKVHESVNAPHSIQNSTRVYIRTGSVSQPYELAEIERIDYLLKRRDQSTKLKDDLIQNANMRFTQLLGGANPKIPYMTVTITPVFPYQPIISLDDMFSFGDQHPYVSKGYSLNDPQRIMDGICKFYGSTDNFSYQEVNQYGLVFIVEALDKSKSQWKSSRQGEEKLFIRLTRFILIIAQALKLAESFLNRCGYLGNLEVKVSVRNIAGENLMFRDNGFVDIDEYRAIDGLVLSSQICMVEDVRTNLSQLISFLLKNVLWIFNCRHAPDGRVDEVLKANKM